MKRPYFPTAREYGQTFTSVDYWRPYIEHVWSSLGLGTVKSCVAGLPGTHPVFIVNDTLVIKFFTDLFGFDAAEVEVAFYTHIAPRLEVPIPSLVAHGALFQPEPDEGWHYPYIVVTRLEGISFGEVGSHKPDAWIEAARFSARVLRAFHESPLPREGVLRANWDRFEQLLSERRRAIRSSIERLPVTPTLRADLLERLDTMPIPYDAATTPKLLHGDLNRDHILGVVRKDGRFEFTGVIDFGDVKVGDPLYDLVPLHFGLLEIDKALLRVFLDAYGTSILGHDFAQRVMDYTLLFEFDVLTEWFEKHEEWRTISNLAELRDRLWGL